MVVGTACNSYAHVCNFQNPAEKNISLSIRPHLQSCVASLGQHFCWFNAMDYFGGWTLAFLPSVSADRTLGDSFISAHFHNSRRSAQSLSFRWLWLGTTCVFPTRLSLFTNRITRGSHRTFGNHGFDWCIYLLCLSCKNQTHLVASYFSTFNP